MAHDLVEFAAEFLQQARDSIEEAAGVKKTIFTSRQSQAICAMGICRIIRIREELGVKDLVNLAVVTTPPEGQKYAELIALRILLGDERDAFDPKVNTTSAGQDDETPAPAQAALPPQLSGASMLLQEILDFLNLERSVDMDKGYAEIKFAETAEDELFSSDANRLEQLSPDQRLELARKMTAHQVIGGKNGILDKQLRSWDDVFAQAKKDLMRSIPIMRTEELIQSHMLSHTEDIITMTRENSLKSMAEMLLASSKNGTLSLKPKEKKLVDSLNHRELSNSIEMLNDLDNLIQRMQLDKQQIAPKLDALKKALEDRFREQAMTYDDVLNHPGLFHEQLNREFLNQLMEHSHEFTDPMDLLKNAKKIDEIFQTDMVTRTYDEYKEEFNEIALEDFIKNPVASGEWIESFEEKVSNYKREKNHDWNDYSNIASDLVNKKDEMINPVVDDYFKKAAQDFVHEMVKKSNIPEQLVDSVDYARDQGLKFNSSSVKKKGKKLGMSNEEIARLIGDVYEYMKQLIQDENPSYERVNSLMERANMNENQFKTLVKLSVDNKREGALGAFACQDLRAVSTMVPNTNKGKSLLEQAIGAGSGENLLNQWFLYGKNLPPWMRDLVKDQAKQVMIDLAKTKAASLIGTSEAGPLPEGTIRPYYLGDDPDIIDIEETLDNILDSGKRLENVSVNDFIVRKEVTGRRCVIFLVDISGSMTGQPLASASLATAMLLMAFARDELGVALFESNTHVICEIDEDIELDEVIDEILDLSARGGTQMGAAIRWADGQFIKSRSQDKMFVMVTDAMLGDFQRCKPHMESIADQGATSVLIVPHTMAGMGNIQQIVESANAQIIPVRDWKKFPEIVSKILSRA